MRKWRKSRLLAWCMALVLLLGELPINTMHVQAKGNDATVYKMWADLVQGENGELQPNPESVVFADEQQGEKTLIAKFITDGVYAYCEEDDELVLILNNASVNLPIEKYSYLPDAWELSGDSCVIVGNLVISADASAFPAYAGSIVAGDVFAFYSAYPYADDGEKGWRKQYEYDVNGDHTFYGWPIAHKLVIDEGATLTLGVFQEEPEALSIGSTLNAQEIVVNGTLQMQEAENDEKPACFGIFKEGSLRVGEKGRITGTKGATLSFGELATCTGVSLYARSEEKPEELVAFELPADHGYTVFDWSQDGKWILGDAGQDENNLGSNEYRVYYDDQFWDGMQHAFVKLGDQNIHGAEAMRFQDDEALTFHLIPAPERVNCGPIVIIRQWNGEGYEMFSNRSEEAWDQEHLFVINKNADGSDYDFTYTPMGDKGFYMDVIWSDYDYTWGDDDSFVVETRAHGSRSVVSFDKEWMGDVVKEPLGASGERRRFSNGVIRKEGFLTVTFAPKEGFYIEHIGMDTGDGDYRCYVTGTPEPGREEQVSIYAKDSGFKDNGDGSFSYVLRQMPKSKGISFEIESREIEVANKKIHLNFNEEYWDDQAHAKVEINGVAYRSNEEVSFEKNEVIRFTLKPHSNRINCNPVVLLRKQGEEFSNMDWLADDANHLLTMTKNADGSVYEFSYTPTNDLGFSVDVAWSDYDFMWGDEKSFVVETRDGNHYGRNATIQFSQNWEDVMNEPNPQNSPTDGFGVRRRFQNTILDDGNQLSITFAPMEGYYIECIGADVDEQGYRRYVTWTPEHEDEISIYDANSGFTKNGDGSFTYVLTQVPERHGVSFNVECQKLPGSLHFNSRGANVEYRLDNEADFHVLEGNGLDRETLENANAITFRMMPGNQNDTIHGIGIYWNEGNVRMSNIQPLAEGNVFTLERGEGWKDYDVEVILWDCVYTGHYVFAQHGSGEVRVEVGGNEVEWGRNYALTAEQPISFQVTGSVYRVIARRNDGEMQELRANAGIYQYIPRNDQGTELQIFTSKERYDYEMLTPDWENDEYEANFRFRTDREEQGVGGTVSYDQTPVNVATCEEETKLILRDGTSQVKLTVAPNETYAYRFEVNGVDVAESVRENDNVYVWDVSDRDNIPQISVVFVKGEQLTGTVSASGMSKYGWQMYAVVNESNNTGKLKYQWTREDVPIEGATSPIYQFVKEDVGHKVACVVTSTVQVGSIAMTINSVQKADGPNAPSGLGSVAASVQGKADGKITGTAKGMEYSVDQDFGVAANIKQITATEVTGLAAGTYYVRYAETATTKAGAAAKTVVADGPEEKKDESLEEAAKGVDKGNVDEKADDLKKKDNKELVEELKDDKAVEALAKIEETYKEKHAITEKEPESSVGELNAGKILITGAALNMESGSVGLEVSEGSKNDFLDKSNYNNMVAFDLSVVAKQADGSTVDFSKELDVPVTITLPIPDRFEAATVEILHQSKDGTVEKVDCKIDEEKRTVTFTVTHFSPFAMTGGAKSQSMYRMYNPNSGEHFYTAHEAERDMLIGVGWNYEGVAWDAPVYSDIPVYRLYNPNAGDHHYTTSAGERDMLISLGWNDEGIGWYSDEDEGEVLYRLYNPNAVTGTHHYTKSKAESDYLDGIGWNYEGFSWYGVVK